MKITMRTLLNLFIAITSVFGMSAFSMAQEKAPAHEQENLSHEAETSYPGSDGRMRTSEMPEIVVTGQRPLKEEQLIGPNEQPRWTARRRFPTTRVYVIPQGKFEFEWWVKNNVPRHGDKDLLYLYEFEMGLPYRLQFDLYQGYTDQGASFKFSQQSVELRWAMAKWGRLWGNPTWYIEYTTRDSAPDKEEVKLLLGDELASRWHWGVNLVHEWTLRKPFAREEENEITAGLSYTVQDSVFSTGLELKAGQENSLNSNGGKDWITTFKIGPSFLWKPTPSGAIQFAPLIGIGKESEKSQTWLVVSWEL
jgi:hypothetical protein